MTYSTLQWLAPELARNGILKNESWVEKNSAQAAAMYLEKNLRTCATLLAALHPHALSYLQSAPVLAVAALHCAGIVGARSLAHEAARCAITSEWLPRFQNGEKLRDIMQACNLAWALRKLQGLVLASPDMAILVALGRLDPSALAQAIPESQVGQRHWLLAMCSWHHTMIRRFDLDSHLGWAASRFHPAALLRYFHGPANAGDLADFIGSQPNQFNPTWTLARAVATMNAWHDQLAKANHEEKFFLENGLQWEETIDYGRLPVERVVGSFAFRALQSGKALYEDGREMHHCVGSYSSDVISGRSRIYSVVHVETLKRVATLELVGTVNAGYPVSYDLAMNSVAFPPWGLGQIKGPCNAVVRTACYNTAQEFVSIVNRIWAGQPAPPAASVLPWQALGRGVFHRDLNWEERA